VLFLQHVDVYVEHHLDGKRGEKFHVGVHFLGLVHVLRSMFDEGRDTRVILG